EGLERAHYEPVAKGDGAGQIRAAGRVALLSSFLDVQYVIEEGIKRVRRLAADLATKLRAPDGDAGTVMSELTIYVVSSLAGGTGSGAFLDVTLLARKLSGSRAKMVGIFVLPEAFDPKITGDE